MKVFIWVVCFMVIAAIQTAARSSGVILGAIPTMLLVGAGYLSASALCNVYDKHKKGSAQEQQASVDTEEKADD